jgi:hypothetical protein
MRGAWRENPNGGRGELNSTPFQTTGQRHVAPLTAALDKGSPAALRLISPNTRLPIVTLAERAKAEIANAIAEIGDEDAACPGESWLIQLS